jgi:SEC-C motif-containing protein
MRSRYTAYARREIDHITNSLHPSSRHDHDPVAAQRWAEQSDWLGLDVVRVEAGGKADEHGEVEFIAHYREKGAIRHHHEVASFVKEEGQWYFKDGKPVAPKTLQREAPKVGRNDPCPCGSGKKYKKCCGS